MDKIGLTLGKYAPFHKGHQFVIETALNEMDHLIVLIYDAPDQTDIPLNIRSNWIRELYPQVELIEAWDGPTEVGYTDDIKYSHEQYVLNILGNTKIESFYSSEQYGQHMSMALNCKNRIVDIDKKTFNISGTEIRNDTYVNRQYLHPSVYSDLVTNVVFLGAPSTGKTTIAEKMAKEFKTIWMPEYGREYWEQHQINRRLTENELVEIAKQHLKLEDEKILQANKYLFTDTNALTTNIFSQYYHLRKNEELEKIIALSQFRYDIIFLCDVDIPYDNTWDRSGEVNRTIFQKRIVADLKSRKVPFFMLSGNIEERADYIKDVLMEHYKYMNPVEHCKRIKL